MDIVVSPWVDEKSIIDFFTCMNVRPVSVHVGIQQVPIWFEGEPCVSSTGEFAMEMEGFRPDRTYLHQAKIAAFRPTMGHTIHLIQLQAEVNTSRKQHSDLDFFRTTSKPSTCCLLLNTPRSITSFRVVNCCSSNGKSIQSTLSLPINVGKLPARSMAPS